MINNLRFCGGAALIAAVIALTPNSPMSAFAGEGAGKKPAVKVSISAQAKKLLKKHRTTLAGGVLRRRGAKKGQILATGSGEVYAIMHPKNKNALAVGLYDGGMRYGALTIDFSFDVRENEPSLSPLDLPEEAITKLFPEKR